MPARVVSRRRLLALCGAGLASGLLGGTIARGNAHEHRSADPAEPLRIGMVLPLRSGGMPMDANTLELAGEAARKGALMAEEDYGRLAAAGRRDLEVLVASAPDAQSTQRAGQRLAASGEVSALAGGIGRDQALALGRVAEEWGIPFVNIGSASEALRDPGCGSHTFHVEASAAMYLQVLVDAHPDTGRWFLAYSDDEEGRALLGRTRQLVATAGGSEAGSLALDGPAGHPAMLEAIRQSDADTVLMLTDWRNQLDFLGRYQADYQAEEMRPTISGFPYPVTQTRDFLDSLVRAAPSRGVGPRVSLWEPAETPGAVALGESFLARWGVPMDPPAWAAYIAVELVAGAAATAGSLAGEAIVAELDRSSVTVEAHKGGRTGFRSGDRQLRQPLYVIRPDPRAASRREFVRVVEPSNEATDAGAQPDPAREC
ncbi:MAG: ABC transporter substrate-binding protein [Trueperaceae bacterium]